MASLAVLFAQGIAIAAPPQPLTPTGRWNVEFADRMCLLSRPYGKDGATSLVLKPAMIGNGLEIIVTKATTAIANPRSGNVALTVANGPADADARFTAYSTAKARLLRIRVGEDTVALPAVRGTLSIDTDHEGQFAFPVPGIERALPVLATCVDQLRAAYNVSPAELAAVATFPKGIVANYFNTNDYPAEALRKRQFGTAGALIWVESDGRVSSCEIVETSASAVLDQTTCSIMKRRGRLAPGLDSAGKPVRAPAFFRIRWVLPT